MIVVTSEGLGRVNDREGLASTRCSVCLLNKPHSKLVSATPVSVAGKRDFAGRDKRANWPHHSVPPPLEMKVQPNYHANSGLFA